MRIALSITFLTILLFAPVSGQPSSALLTNFAFKYYLNEQLSAAEQKCRQLLADDPENPDANLILGLVLLESPDLDRRLDGRKRIEKYAYASENALLVNFSRGRMHQRMRAEIVAIRFYQKVLEINPDFLPAHLALGEIYYHQMLTYYNRVTDTRVPISLREYAVDDYDQAVYHLKEVLKLDPGNRTALRILAIVYYEMEEYRKMVELLHQPIVKRAFDKNLDMYLGLAYLELMDYAAADSCFREAMKRMKPAEQAQFLNPPGDTRLPKLPAGEFQDSIMGIWRKKDPLYLTDVNERLLEHFGRVAYANLRFGDEKKGREGWKTDRGQVYIRYGKPVAVIDYGKSMDFSAIYSPAQVWVYPEFQFMFTDEFWNGDYRFSQPAPANSPFKERTFTDYSMVARDVFKTRPEKYRLKMEGGVQEVPYKIAFFRGAAGITEGLLYYELRWKQDLMPESLAVKAGFFLMDSSGEQIFLAEESLEIPGNQLARHQQDRRIFNSFKFNPPPGQHLFLFELLNSSQKKYFRDEGSVVVPLFERSNLQMSDILLCYSVEPSANRNDQVRNGYKIVPNPAATFYRDQPLYIYCEVYNLLPKGSSQISYYQVENSVYPAARPNFFKRLFGGRRKSVGFINEYEVSGVDDVIIQTVDISNLKPGEYILELIVEDLVTREKARKKHRFQLKAP